MFGKNDSLNQVETIVGPSVFLRGKLKSDGTIRVQGKVSGELKAKGDVFIDKEASVKASVSARNVVVSGEVAGDLDVSGEIEITETGRVIGNINSGALIIKMGAIFIGKSTMREDQGKDKKQKIIEPEPEPEMGEEAG